jgi:serine/threonine-protein kinase
MFMAPEQAKSYEEVDARTDIYALGAVAYFLLIGRAPFAEGDVAAILQAHATHPAPPPSTINPEIPEDLERIVLRCLAKRREERFQDVNKLGAALALCQCSGKWTSTKANAWWKAADRTIASSLQGVSP